MKKKKLVIFFLALIAVYIIYNFTYKEEFTYLAIGDDLAKGHTPFDTYGESYTDFVFDYLKEKNSEAKINKEFVEEDLRVKDLITKLKNAETSGGKTFTGAIKEAELITISIGSEELFSKLRSNYELYKLNSQKLFTFIDEMTKELDELITEIKKIKKPEIYLIGYYNPLFENDVKESKLDSIFNYLDIKLQEIEKKHKIHYISIHEEFKSKSNFLPNKSHAFPSLEGYNFIANKIIEEIELSKLLD